MKKIFNIIYEYITHPSRSYEWGIEIKKHIPTHTVTPRKHIPIVKELFHDAIKQNNNHTIKKMIVNNYSLIEKLNEMGLTPLMQAVVSKNHGAIEILLSNGADALRIDKDGWSARTWAIFIKDTKAQQLLSQNSSILINSNDSSAAMFGVIAMYQGEKNESK
ncbi:MAG: hypothetical protein KAI79_05305 [Bacteroidales bacterium]|nr:hypothetical protein [Bacteroidales bacterium]